jgi:Flp pilus assembly pilin Flp
MRFVEFVSKFYREELGQDMLEYALVLLAILALVVSGSITLSGTISNGLSTITAGITALSLP